MITPTQRLGIRQAPRILALFAIFLIAAEQAPAQRRRGGGGLRRPGSRQTNVDRTKQKDEKEQPSLSYQVSVTATLIDVVVTDRRGNPVAGLVKEDFLLYEDGELQEITDFSEEGMIVPANTVPAENAPAGPKSDPPPPTETPAATPPPTSLAGRTIVIFFDESNQTANELSRARAACRRFIEKNTRKGDSIALLGYGGSLQVLSEPTDDVKTLVEALSSEGDQGIVQTPDVGSSRNAFDDITGGAASPGASENPVIRFQDTPAIQEIMQSESNQRLYKALEMVGQTLSKIPGRKTIVFFSRGFGAQFADQGLFHYYREMVNRLNSANVAIYPVDPGGAAAKPMIDMSSNTSPTQGGLQNFASQIDSLKILAADTGGQALVYSTDLDRQLTRMARSTSHYYLLGYTPKAASKGSGFRDIKVKVKRKGMRVLTRKGYYRSKDFAELSKREKKEQLETALLSWVQLSDLPIDLRTEFYPLKEGKSRLSVELLVTRGLIAGGDKGGKMEILYYLRLQDDKKPRKETLEVSIDPSDLTRDLVHVRGFDVAPGNYWLKVIARDRTTGRLGSDGAYLTIPKRPQEGPSISSLVPLVPAKGSHLVLAEEDKTLAADALQLGDELFVPAVDNIFLQKSRVVCLIRVGNLVLDKVTSLPRLTVRYRVWRNRKPFTEQMVHYRAEKPPDATYGVPLHVALPTESPGDYRIEVVAYDVSAGKGMKTELKYIVAPPTGG